MVHYLGLKQIFGHYIATENLSFHVFLTVILLPKNIQSSFIHSDSAPKENLNGNSCCELY